MNIKQALYKTVEQKISANMTGNLFKVFTAKQNQNKNYYKVGVHIHLSGMQTVYFEVSETGMVIFKDITCDNSVSVYDNNSNNTVYIYFEGSAVTIESSRLEIFYGELTDIGIAKSNENTNNLTLLSKFSKSKYENMGNLGAYNTPDISANVISANILYGQNRAANTPTIFSDGEAKFIHKDYAPDFIDSASGIGAAFKASRGVFNQFICGNIIAPYYNTRSEDGKKIGETTVTQNNDPGWKDKIYFSKITKDPEITGIIPELATLAELSSSEFKVFSDYLSCDRLSCSELSAPNVYSNKLEIWSSDGKNARLMIDNDGNIYHNNASSTISLHGGKISTTYDTDSTTNISLEGNVTCKSGKLSLTKGYGIGTLNADNRICTGVLFGTQEDVAVSAGSAEGTLIINAENTIVVGTLGIMEGGDLIINSDKRLKTNISKLEKPVLDAVLSTEISTFNYISNQDSDKTLGLMAQDLEVNFPELSSQLVSTAEDKELGLPDRKTIKETKLVYVLWKALQEEAQKRQELENKLNRVLELLEGNNNG